ncbi:phosphate acetyltransferase [Lactobacillus sp. DCY120]|uniref:Phosphate acetyltransferase n=1 Tax=Bombilactobacillus apium TaxID=2675299 RepID=A0A850R538_9LACO|nr:phosphate acetyltransferase [Bombilactobacillus apium]NVY97081.1 phosphate acetyltransferase [Bombilactobacillus apium]
MELFTSLKQKVTGHNLKLVFPEATDSRILKAATRLFQEHILTPVFLGEPTAVQAAASAAQVDITGIETLDPNNYSDFADMVTTFVERRHGKNTPEQAQTMLRDPNYFGTMLVYMQKVDGMVSGAIHPTGDTVRPALQIIKVQPGLTRTSGAFIMQKGDQRYLFADCAININPSAQELAEIAATSAQTAKVFDIEPKVALLSFSTKGSAKGEEIDKVAEATKIVQEQHPELAVDGELQFDAAFVPEVAQQKAPDSAVAGQSTVFVFPELQSGNIGYKIAQRFGGFEAIGPVLQGLNQPVSDLSRGCNEEDVYKLALITAAQAVKA